MTTIGARVAAHAEATPANIFCSVWSSGAAEDITFRQLFDRSTAYARHFQARGMGPGQVVVIMLRHGPHLFYSFVGAILAGAIPSFMPFPSAKQRTDLFWQDHQRLFDRLKPRLIVTYEENYAAARDAIANFSIETLIASDVVIDASLSVPLTGLSSSPNDVACLQHSSGTTGLKKGVMLTHRAIIDHVARYSKSIALEPSDRIASWLPLYHDMGFIACFMTALLQGNRLIAIDPFEWVMRPQILLDAIERYRCTLCWLPNFAFAHLVNATRAAAVFDLSSMRAFINCSEPCKAATLERFIERFESSGVGRSKVSVCYALAENVFGVTQSELGKFPSVMHLDTEALSQEKVELASAARPSQELLSCGTPLEGVSVEIRDMKGAVLPAQRLGQISIASDFLFSGYYLQDELTALKLQDGWYQTGDVGFMNDGELFVTGRMDDMIIVNGRNYYSHEIEFLVNDVPEVIPGRSVAIGVEEQRSDATVIAVLVECRDPIANGAEVTRKIREAVLERVGIAVHAVVPLRSGQLVKTTSGKISRVKNKELYVQGAFSEPLGNVATRR